MKLTIEIEKESAGKWIAEVLELPGCLVYGKTPPIALRKAQALAYRIIGDCLEHNEDPRTGRPFPKSTRASKTLPFSDVQFAAA